MSGLLPPERLQKSLARLGFGSRRQIESWIRAGRLMVNGAPATLGMRVGASDRIQLDGRLLRRPGHIGRAVYLCHRSPGDPLHGQEGDLPPSEDRATGPRVPRGSVAERLPRRAGRRFTAVSPMPRGDGGLELLSSDGELAAQLQRAVGALTSGFSVRVRGEFDESRLARLLEGELDSGERLEILRCEPVGGEGMNRWYSVEARGTTGRKLRQLFERQGIFVSRVLRTRLGSLVLERSLPRGQFRELLPAEVAALLSGVAPGPAAEQPARGAGSSVTTGSRSSRLSRRGSRAPAGRGRAR